MRRHPLRWIFAQIAGDAVLINVATLLAWFVRYELELAPVLGDGFFYQPYTAYIPLAIALTFLSIAIFRFEGLYAPMRGRAFIDELYSLLNGTTTALLLIMAFTFFIRPLVFSRAMYLYAAALVVILLGAERLIQRTILARRRIRGIGVDRVLIVGAGEVGRALMRNIVAKPDLAYQVIGFVDDDPDKARTDIGRFKALGTTHNLPGLLREYAIDEVIITLPWTARDKIVRMMNVSQQFGAVAKVVPDLFQLSLSRVVIDDVGGIPLIGIREARMGTVDSVVKRMLDLTISILALLCIGWLMLVIAFVIRLDSAGPIIFMQTRIGRRGKPFTAYKFRSMRQGAEEEIPTLIELNEAKGPLFKIRNDPRRTRFGRLLRRTSLDELPQVFNVLRGEMSIVGPRPPMPSEVEQYQEWHKRRLEVSPGITGLSQVSGRSELTFDETAMLDIYYIENWTPWLDLWIMFKTIPTVLLARGAY